MSKQFRSSAERRNTTVIEAAVTYAQAIAAFRAGFPVDPDGEWKTAHGESGKHYERLAERSLRILATTSARSVDSLSAKAAAAVIVLDDDEGGLEDVSEEFLRLFIDDVRVITRGIIDQRHGESAGRGEPGELWSLIS
jgi:hypothetical protein